MVFPILNQATEENVEAIIDGIKTIEQAGRKDKLDVGGILGGAEAERVVAGRADGGRRGSCDVRRPERRRRKKLPQGFSRWVIAGHHEAMMMILCEEAVILSLEREGEMALFWRLG